MRYPFPYTAFLALALCSLVWLTNSRTAAQQPLDDERAKAHFFAGESHFAAERWADAAREFALAYELSQRPEMLINLSRAHERDRHLAEAIADLQLLIARHPDNPYRAEAETRIAGMRAELQSKGLGGRAGEERTGEPVPATEQAPPQPQAEVASAQAQVLHEDEAQTKPRSHVWPPSAVTLAAGSAALVVGAVALGTGVRAHHLYGQLNDRCPGGQCEPGFEATRDHGRALSRTSTALTFASVALAGATAVLWIYDVKRERRQAVSMGIQGAGVQLRARF